MRSLAWKMTLAFLLIGVIGATLVALLVGLRTRSEFSRYISERDQEVLYSSLTTYYQQHNGWDGLAQMLNSSSQLSFYSRDIMLADAQGNVVLGNHGHGTAQLGQDILQTGDSIDVDGKTVGFVLFKDGSPRGREEAQPFAAMFVERVTWAAVLSSIIAAFIALALGFLLARTLTRPIRELTSATKVLASGKLGQHVVVRSRDEIGELATSFNQMSADLARASQLRQQMTADLAHDLRTPLTILRGYTEGLKDGRLQGSGTLFGIMHEEVTHLQRMVEDLRVLSLADAGELPLNRRAVDPSALLERAGLAYMVHAEEQGIALRVEAGEGLPSILVDTDRMAQVLNNLLSNALRYTKQGEIVLAARAAGAQVQLSVGDTGAGIAADDLPFIFDRFYRADKSRHRNDTSASGLGLAIAKAIVEAHGGTIAVESEPEHGTTFTILLPAAKAPAASPAPALPVGADA